MSIEKLTKDLEELKGKFFSVEKDFESSKGLAKSKLKNILNSLQEDISTLEVEISKAETAKLTKEISEIEMGDRCVVKNMSYHMKTNNDVRFSPNIEVQTVMTGFIKDQVEAGLFLLLNK